MRCNSTVRHEQVEMADSDPNHPPIHSFSVGVTTRASSSHIRTLQDLPGLEQEVDYLPVVVNCTKARVSGRPSMAMVSPVANVATLPSTSSPESVGSSRGAPTTARPSASTEAIAPASVTACADARMWASRRQDILGRACSRTPRALSGASSEARHFPGRTSDRCPDRIQRDLGSRDVGFDGRRATRPSNGCR